MNKTRRDRIVGFAAQQRLPAIYHFREYVVAGGLLSYGVSITEAYRQCGVYTAKILKGAKPAELPVLQSTKFELVINLTTANTLCVKISDDLLSLRRGDRIIIRAALLRLLTAGYGTSRTSGDLRVESTKWAKAAIAPASQFYEYTL
jgi:hypothetical protein